MSDEKDQFPRFKKDDFGEGTGWLFAGGLVACAHQLIDAVERMESTVGDDKIGVRKEVHEAIAKMQDTINATMEAAYAPTEKK